MLYKKPSRRGLGALAAACLLTIAMPADLAWAQKSKTKGEQPAATQSTGTAISSSFTVDVPAIESIGANVDDAVIRDILTGKLAEHADELAGLSATSITVPQIDVTATTNVDGKDTTTTVTITDFVLSDVTDGVADSVTVGGMQMASDEANAEFGAMSASTFDIGGMLGMYGLVNAAGDTELKTVYSDFSFEGGTLTAEDMECTFGAIKVGEFKARPLAYSFTDMMALAQSLEEQGEEPSPQDMARLLKMYADMLTAFESAPATFDGFDCSGTDEDGRPVSFTTAGMEIGGMSPGIYPSISVTGVDIAVEEDGQVSLGEATFKAMDLSGPIATIQAAPDSVDAAWFEAHARELVPAFEGFSLSDIAVDIPDPEAENERIVASLGGFDLSLADYLNGIPTKVASSLDSLVVDLPAESGDEQIQQLIALGITTIDADFGLDLAWNEADNTIAINDISVSGVDLASVKLAGTIANATSALFSSNNDEAMAAGMGLALAGLKLDVEDMGLTDLILSVVAAEQGGDAASMRPVFAGLAEGTIIGMLAGAAEAQKVGGAVSAFISGKAKSLSIEVTAKEPPGLGMMDFMAAESDPSVLIGKVTIDASAQ